MAFSLAFSQAPPDHPFVGEFFPVQLTLIDGDHEIHGTFPAIAATMSGVSPS